MPDASTDYTVDELVVSLIARDIHDHETGAAGGRHGAGEASP